MTAYELETDKATIRLYDYRHMEIHYCDGRLIFPGMAISHRSTQC